MCAPCYSALAGSARHAAQLPPLLAVQPWAEPHRRVQRPLEKLAPWDEVIVLYLEGEERELEDRGRLETVTPMRMCVLSTAICPEGHWTLKQWCRQQCVRVLLEVEPEPASRWPRNPNRDLLHELKLLECLSLH